MKKIIALFIVALLASFSTVSAVDTETTSTWTDDTVTTQDDWAEESEEEDEENDESEEENEEEENEEEENEEEENEDEENEDENEDEDGEGKAKGKTKNLTDTEVTAEGTEKATVDKAVKAVQKNFIIEYNKIKNAYKTWSWVSTFSGSTFIEAKKILMEGYKRDLASATERAEAAFAAQEKKYAVQKVYKNIYRTKYQERLAKLSEEKLQTLINRIDALILKVQKEDSDAKKDKFIPMLEALRAVTLEQDNAAWIEANDDTGTTWE